METVYEKVCPACGRSATLASKFCSGCGHQYRTVFQDQPGTADSVDDSAAGSGSGDLRTFLLVALIPLVVVLFMIAVRPSNVQNAAQVVPVANTYQAASVVPVASASAPSITAGMRPLDVQQALGRPDNVKVVPIGGVSTQQWYYSRNGRTLEVDFNTNDVVENWTNF